MRWVSNVFSPGVGQEAWQGMDWAPAQPQGEEQRLKLESKVREFPWECGRV